MGSAGKALHSAKGDVYKEFSAERKARATTREQRGAHTGTSGVAAGMVGFLHRVSYSHTTLHTALDG